MFVRGSIGDMMDDETRVIMLESELAEVSEGVGWYIPPAAIQEILKVLRHGDSKHPNEEWKTILPHVHESCAAGHIAEYENGLEREEESGCHHLAHAIVRYMFALSLWLSAKSKEHRHIDTEAREI